MKFVLYAGLLVLGYYLFREAVVRLQSSVLIAETEYVLDHESR